VSNALWLSVALPDWFFSTLLNPFGEGLLTAIPAFGAMCLAFGVFVVVVNRQFGALIVAVSPAFSHLFVACAGFLREQVDRDIAPYVLISFVALQVALVGYLLYRLANARIAVALLGVFSLTYALFAAFVASMAFSDVWL